MKLHRFDTANEDAMSVERDRARRQLRGAEDALDFALRTVADSGLTEDEIRERISGVAGRTLDALRGLA